MILTSRGIIRYANRYAEEAERMAAQEKDEVRREELRVIAANCRKVPENPPETFYEALQFMWFVQIGGILTENPLSLNPGRFDQYTDPFYEADLAAGRITPDFGQELVEELAAMVAWLASEDCAFSTGAVFDISGGRATY